MSQMPKLFRLQTYHGTQVYLDPQGRLRHGQADATPDNVRAQASDTQLVLWHDAGADGFRGLGFPTAPDGSLIGPADGQDGSEVVSGEPQVLDIETVGPVIGLRYHRTYVCSELDGRVVLNRDALGEWERFELIEVEPALPPVPVADPEIEELTVDPPPAGGPPTIELTAAEAAMPHEPEMPPHDQDWLAQATVPAEPEPPAGRRAERLVANSTSLGPIKLVAPDPAPRPGLWRRFMRSLLGD
jgi:hypothetical protein